MPADSENFAVQGLDGKLLDGLFSSSYTIYARTLQLQILPVTWNTYKCHVFPVCVYFGRPIKSVDIQLANQILPGLLSNLDIYNCHRHFPQQSTCLHHFG
jgi:hypothetical protein